MIARIWHGTTIKENAQPYEELLISGIFKEIETKTGEGFRGVQLLRRDLAEEVEFTTMIWFKDIDAIKRFTGGDLETAYIQETAKRLLLRYDFKVTHSKFIYSSGTDKKL